MKHYVTQFTAIEELEAYLNEPRIRFRVEQSRSVLVQVFTASVDREFYRQLYPLIQKRIPGAVVVACSTMGEIANGIALEAHSSVSLSFFSEARLQARAVALRPGQETARAAALCRDMIDDNSDLRGILILLTPLTVDSRKVMDGFVALPDDIALFGGAAGNYTQLDLSLVALDGEVMDSAMVVVSLAGAGLRILQHRLFGWMPLGKELTITHASGRTVHSIDNMPAADVYNSYVAPDAKDFFAHALQFPLLVEREGASVGRVPVSQDEAGNLNFIADVYEGERFRFGFGDINVIIDSIDGLMPSVREFEPEAVYLYSCGCRRLFLKQDVSAELLPFQAQAPTAGFFTYGEFDNSIEEPQILNSSMVAVCIKELPEEHHREESILQIRNPSRPEENEKLHSMRRLMHFVARITSELENANRELERLAQRDGLTDVLNRRSFDQELEYEVSRSLRYDTPLCLMLLDIDHFKAVHDSYGHQTGDDVLKHFACIAARDLRDSDLLARYGGEEFAVLLPQTPVADAMAVAERIRTQVEEGFCEDTDEAYPNITVSIGVAILKKSEPRANTLVEHADLALYRCKHEGRNRVCLYESDSPDTPTQDFD